MSLALYLSNVGIPLAAAQQFDSSFGNVDPVEFVNGLDECARLVAFDEKPQKLPPTLEPWLTLYTAIAQNGHQPARKTYLDTVPTLDAEIQFAVIDAVDARADALQTWWKQNQVSNSAKKSSAELVADLNRMGYVFAWNEVLHGVEVNGAAITDEMESIIFAKARDATGFKNKATLRDAWVKDAVENNSYHPIRRYLNHLAWNGDDVIGQTAAHFTSENGIFEMMFRKWCVGAVARVFDGDAQNRALLLESVEGLGKDTFVRWLCSPMPEYFYDSPIRPDDKDNVLRMATKWIWNLSEVSTTTRRQDVEAIKHILTIADIQERKAYGRYDTRAKVMASFIGSFNDDAGGVFNSPSGTRRWAVCPVSALDWNYKQLDVNQLWAQAVALYQGGAAWQYDEAERQMVSEINETFQVLDVVQEVVNQYFDIDPTQTTWAMSSLQILEVIKSPMFGNQKFASDTDAARKMAIALKKLGLGKPAPIRINGKQVKGYRGIKRTV